MNFGQKSERIWTPSEFLWARVSGKVIKIDDAYLDARFNKEVDKASKYTTKTILCAPIKDNDGKNIGE